MSHQTTIQFTQTALGCGTNRKMETEINVMEGDSVALRTGLAKINQDDNIIWTFGETFLVNIYKGFHVMSSFDGTDGRFINRLSMDSQTGSLTIKNINTNHSGLYYLFHNNASSKIFSVAVHDEVKSVMEGDSVTLHTHLTHIQRRDHILWKFGPQETRIAEIYKQNIDIEGGIEIFGDRLKLDSQTGSLTITNIRITDSGLYILHIISDRGISYKRFNVTVYARLPVPVIIRNSSQCSSSSERSSVSKCVLLCSVMNVTHVSLSWYKGKSLLSSISVSDLNIRLSLPLEVEYQDTNTYRCVINNPITNHTQHLNISDVCQPCSDKIQCFSFTGAVIRLVLSALVGMATIAVAVYEVRSRRAEQKQRSDVTPRI
ncbi:putative CD48 antigen-like [Triplophysa rosa]|uniref:CD48 antigen-like n=1 Tax=Triplophysa rosa TaxID=992332 RepID=A0A9W7WAK8_TRIRA|nr:putative CD48 antigen-like [Triplophysa rosa]